MFWQEKCAWPAGRDVALDITFRALDPVTFAKFMYHNSRILLVLNRKCKEQPELA